MMSPRTGFTVFILVMSMVAVGQGQSVTMTPDPVDLNEGKSEEITIHANLSDFVMSGNYSAIEVNMTFMSLDTNVVTMQTEDQTYVLEAGETEIDTAVTIKGENEGTTTVNFDLCVTVNGTTNHSTYSVNVTVMAEEEVNLDYVLIYINMVMCFICIMFVSFSATMRGLSGTWGQFGWIIVGFLMYSILRPTVTLVLIKMIKFMPPQAVGILSTVCSPPSMLAIPVAALLQADVYLMMALALAADVLAACILPVWILQFGNMDAAILIEPRQVPYGVIVIYFLLTVIAVTTGMIVRRTRPEKARSLAAATPVVTFVTILIAVSLDAYHLRTALSYVDARSAIYASIEPVIILIGGFALATFTSLDPNKVKAVCVFLLIKGQSVSTALLSASGAPRRDLVLAVASSSFLSLVSLLIGLLLGVGQCIVSRGDLNRREGYRQQDLSLEIDSAAGDADDDSVDFSRYLQSSMLMVNGNPEKDRRGPANNTGGFRASSIIAPFVWM